MKQFSIVIIVLLAIVGIGAGIIIFSGGDNDPNVVSSEETMGMGGEMAPAFALKNYEGEEISSDSFLGKPHILNTWAVWCPFCVEELKDFAKLQEEFGDAITIVSINRAESLSKAKTYTDDLGVSDSIVFLMDPSDSFYKSIGAFTMPETLFVSAEGKVLRHKRGFMRLAEMEQAVRDLFGL